LSTSWVNSSLNDKETNWIKSIGLWQLNLNCCVFASLKFLDSLSIYGRCCQFFFLNKNNLWYLNPLICVDAQVEVNNASYKQDHCWFFYYHFLRLLVVRCRSRTSNWDTAARRGLGLVEGVPFTAGSIYSEVPD
jgi:hypothetical protein